MKSQESSCLNTNGKGFKDLSGRVTQGSELINSSGCYCLATEWN